MIALDGPTARFLLASLERTTREQGQVSLIEVDVSAHAPQMQRTLIELGFLPAAYVPAMVFSEVERLDIVKMVRLLAPPDFPPLELSPRARAMADLVLEPFARQRVLPQIEQAVRELPMFRGLDEEQVRRLAGTCDVVRFEAGQPVLEEECSTTRCTSCCRAGSKSVVRGSRADRRDRRRRVPGRARC